jgi:hypothetical protein
VRRERKSEPLESAGEHPSPQPTPGENAVTHEEQSLVWHALESLPENYREPLILFYREEQSVARVAEALELSEDAVKQRLSRGRELLRTQMATLVEGALKRTRPGPVFTLAVLGALPGVAVSSAAAATIGAAGKAAPAVKAISAIGLLGSAFGILGGFGGAALGSWIGWQTAGYQRQREFLKRSFRWFAVLMLTWMAPFIAVALTDWRPFAGSPRLQVPAFIVWMIFFIGLVIAWSVWVQRRTRQICVEEVAAATVQVPLTPVRRWLMNLMARWEPRRWRSRWSLLGLPLVDVNFGGAERFDIATWTLQGSPRQTARGWIAIGDRAQGILFAFGNTAVGGIAIGGLSVGLVSIGGLAAGGLVLGGVAAGIFPFGGLALGVGALGGLAVGWWALGGGAVAWEAAKGGAAFAHDFAVGGQAFATHANDEAAKAFFASHAFFHNAEAVLARLTPLMQGPWFAISVVCVSLSLPVLFWFLGYRRRRPTAEAAS